jgi:ABC-type multidrug transport system ATPase subunit
VADRVIVMRGGRIVLSGTVEETRHQLEDAYLSSGGITETEAPPPE